MRQKMTPLHPGFSVVSFFAAGPFDDYPGFQQIPDMPILLQQSV